MTEVPAHGIPVIEEHEASPEVAEIFANLKQQLQTPSVPNWAKLLASSPSALKMYTGMLYAFYEHMSLSQSLVAMICFTIAERSNCTYCAALNELTCRTLGVDEATLTAGAVFKVLPPVRDLVDHRITVTDVRDVQIGDLLGRRADGAGTGGGVLPTRWVS